VQHKFDRARGGVLGQRLDDRQRPRLPTTGISTKPASQAPMVGVPYNGHAVNLMVVESIFGKPWQLVSAKLNEQTGMGA
jgi:hypothetical protein